MAGGTGNDIFSYSTLGDSSVGGQRDLIKDFQKGADRIDLVGIDGINGGSDDAFVFVGTSHFSHTAGELLYSQSATRTVISGDTNGDGSADFQIVLHGLIALDAADFIL